MPVRWDPARRPVVALAVAALVAACTGGAPGSAWTAAPAPASSTLPPAASTTSAPPSDAPATSAIPTPVPSTPPATAAASSAVPTGSPHGSGLTDEEFAGLTAAWGISPATVDPPPPVRLAEAERIVRARYPGDRPLVWSGLVARGDPSRVGWMVVLGTAPGQRCDLHPGLLERAFEGGIVDAASGELDFIFVCG
jgi:hypothetical protein